MALINCPDCNKQISDKIANCIQCGCPIPTAKSKSTPTTEKEQTIQQTSKKLKMRMLIAVLLMIGGCAGSMGSVSLMGNSNGELNMGIAYFSTICSIAFVTGAVLWIVVKFKVWWHHK
ncbi:MAG: hypothetical protein GY853_06120 [PVC group bacterium]|nr:hypothetical protein [PVC group bacterium]